MNQALNHHTDAPPPGRLVHLRSGLLVSEGVITAKTFVQLAVGLLGVLRADQMHAMAFPHTRSIHTFGMMFPIDILFLDKDGVCVAFRMRVPPFRCLIGPISAVMTIELAPGTLGAIADLRTGDKFEMIGDDCGSQRPS